MWCLVITLCASFYVNSADNSEEIEINFYRDRAGELQCRGNSGVLVRDAPFRVYVNYPGNIYRARCYRSSDNTEALFNQLWKEPVNERAGYVSNEMKMNRIGNWSYSCEFYTRNCDDGHKTICYYYLYGSNTPYQDHGVKCSFAVQVLKPEQISAKVIGRLIATNGVYFSETHDYYFYDGKPVDFVCHKTSGGYVKLSYTTAAGEFISTGYQATDSVDLYMKLTADLSNDTYLACSITDELYRREVVIRLRLIFSSTNKPALGFEVNGLILPIVKRNKARELLYEYKYYPGELLMVDVVKDDQTYDDFTCSVEGHNIPESLIIFFKKGTQKIAGPLKFVLNEEQISGSVSLCCTVLVSKPQKSSYYISVTFKYYSPDFSPFIGGLSMANVLMKYSTLTENVIKYDYIRDEILNLTCGSPDHSLYTEWLYYRKAVLSPQSPVYIPRRPFQLNSGRNKTIIQCTVASSLSNRNTSLELIRNKAVEIVSTTPSFEVTTVEAPKTTTGKKAGASENGQPTEKDENPLETPSRKNPGQPNHGSQKGNVAGSELELLQGGDAVKPVPQETEGELEKKPPEEKGSEKYPSKGGDEGQPMEGSLGGNKGGIELNSSQENVEGSRQNSPKVDYTGQTLERPDLPQGNKEQLNQERKQDTGESVQKQTNEIVAKPTEIPVQENAEGSTLAGHSEGPQQKSPEEKIKDSEQQPGGNTVNSIDTLSPRNYPINTTQKNTKVDTPKRKPQNNASTKKPSPRTTKKSAWRRTKKPIKPSTVKSTERPTVKPTEGSKVKTTESPTVKQTETPTVKPSETTPRITDAPVVASSTEFVVLSAGESGSTGFRPTSPIEDKPDHRYRIIAAAAAVVLVIIAVVLWIAVDLKKRKQKRRCNATEIDYQNLPQHNEGPMPTPAQWDSYANDATYAVPTTDLENLYSKPVPKSQRNTKIIEPMYVEARDAKKINPTYASVQNEPTYASVQNSYSPTYASVQKTTDGPTYASVQKTTDGPTYASVQKTTDGPTYASVQKTTDGPTYASVQKTTDGPTYASVQKTTEGPTYASVQKTTDAPTYAEVSKNDYQNLESMARKDNNFTYAEIYKSDLRSSKRKPVPSAKPEYAQIMPKNLEELNYVNIQEIKSQREKLSAKRYENVDAKNEEIEPAYCEVNVNKR